MYYINTKECIIIISAIMLDVCAGVIYDDDEQRF